MVEQAHKLEDSGGEMVELAARQAAPRSAATRVGVIVDWDDERGPVVDYAGNPHGPIVARSALALDHDEAARLIQSGASIVLCFERARTDSPIILGVIQEIDRSAEASPPPSTEPEGKELYAVVDGRRVKLEAEDEIELRCGKASITLRRNGRVVIRGAYVETRSSGVNRIRGGSVAIN